MNIAVEARGLGVERGGRSVLRELDFAVPAGSLTGLLGPSGCGKTTLMRALVGVQARVSGGLTVLGAPAGAAALRSRIGYVTQDPAVYGDLTVRENLRYFAAVRGVRRGRRRAAADRAIAEVDLGDHADALARDLSGGQHSRVSLAAALLGGGPAGTDRPELLVLDEPTVGLDPVLRRDLWGHFGRLAAAGATVLVSSHVMDEAERCQRLLLLRDGRLLADEEPAALLRRTGAPDVEAAFLHLVDEAAAGGSRTGE
ncbi:multidrug ABC transporter ATP-binding protein [Mangrovactinospora gilvigrisea]|uniref:Multidrug ABC transporter ATP-binding protein n=1 Tax=Mangrovactinospora gilvigrisea TaxID=1428644 RepID=A0A1J7C6Y2_9ACTN|nr:ABC transporter ATP-binding protein [Mangrovactinospora gilvigrisea]OIV37292.1 multidrug ABC transporter ATP-binding protein [Mangrovactinospora gilvigrisea]